MSNPIPDRVVRAAVRAYWSPRLHVNDSTIDREIDMRAALEAAREAEFEAHVPSWDGAYRCSVCGKPMRVEHVEPNMSRWIHS